ncbi:MAG: bifunctional isocitrate dehydrogenase kinase/phosphatase [Gammaproteobacteria bacterium]
MRILAHQIARTILAGFEKHFAFHQEVTSGARERFERRDWPAAQRAAIERISLYDRRVREIIAKVRETFGITELDEPLWREVKAAYLDLLRCHCRPELAETFYNSVFCQMFERKYFNNANIFVESVADRRKLVDQYRVYMSFHPKDGGLHTSVRELLSSFYFSLPFEDLERDTANIVDMFLTHSPLRRAPVDELRIDVLETPFFRNKAAYLIGRVMRREHCYPFVVPLLNNGRGAVYADALLTTGDQLGLVFSFSRAYFMVKTPVPAATIHFLESLLHNKPLAELYMSIGFHKQAKNQFYRDFLHHLRDSSDPFIIAPGARGMVMSVFTLQSYPYVFKVIKDRFDPPKEVTHEQVIHRYLLVKQHDRVGRMADTLEFSDAAFPRHRFSPQLLEELQRVAPSSLEIEDDIIVIKHLYIERRMRPLNLFLEQASESEARAAIADWGLAIKELMAANIFPGDLLFKNFGVTRQGRVVFYDYDELSYLTECRFRKIPEPRYPEDELAAEPAFDVGPHDVFPEEFLTFITTDPQRRQMLLESHPELLDYRYWRQRQQDVENGVYTNVYPYAERFRFLRNLPVALPN